jgi:hypothetical protein
MANWYGSARSNQFTVTDMDGLKHALAPFGDIEIAERGDKVCLLVTDGDYGGWRSVVFDEQDEEIEFDPAVHIMPYAKEGEVVVLMEAGAEKLRYITGNAQAFIRKGDEVRSKYLDLSQIYQMAADEFGIDVAQINVAEY